MEDILKMNWKITKTSCFLTIILSAAFITSCNEVVNTPENIQRIVDSSGNRNQLMIVLAHYQKRTSDSLALKAAYFLIENMKDSYYYDGSLLKDYMNYPKLINRDVYSGQYIMNSFRRSFGEYSTGDLSRLDELETITAREMIDNIDVAIKVWSERNWAKSYSFDQFCEYVLPFRVGDAVPDYDRREIYQIFKNTIDSVEGGNGSVQEACRCLNDRLRDEQWLYTTRMSFLPHLRASDLIRYRTGDCSAMADLAIYAMRAEGVPVGIDFVPQWPNMREGHCWNVLLDTNGKTVVFLGAEDNPGVKHKPGTLKGKVYRLTYKRNKESLAMIKDGSDVVPELFSNPRLMDVTDIYTKTFDFQLPVDTHHGADRFAYLSVFNDKDWSAIAWGKLKEDSICFNKVEGGIVYLPVFYRENDTTAANFPFILDSSGALHFLRPDTTRKCKMLLTRIYPSLPDDFWLYQLVGGFFEASNEPDFSHSEILYRVSNKPAPFWNDIQLSREVKYRYVRYVSAPGQFCGIADMLYMGNDGRTLAGTVIGSAGSGKTNVVDGDFSTYFAAKEPNGSWVGLDFGKPTNIAELRFAAKMNAKQWSYVIPGHRYELFYWRDNKWTSLGEQVASRACLEIDNGYPNSLFLLCDKARLEGARIFTYTGGRQIWW